MWMLHKHMAEKIKEFCSVLSWMASALWILAGGLQLVLQVYIGVRQWAPCEEVCRKAYGMTFLRQSRNLCSSVMGMPCALNACNGLQYIIYYNIIGHVHQVDLQCDINFGTLARAYYANYANH